MWFDMLDRGYGFEVKLLSWLTCVLNLYLFRFLYDEEYIIYLYVRMSFSKREKTHLKTISILINSYL